MEPISEMQRLADKQFNHGAIAVFFIVCIVGWLIGELFLKPKHKKQL